MWLEMVWGAETKKNLGGHTLSLAPPVAGWWPSGAHRLSLAAQQAASISRKEGPGQVIQKIQSETS
jgi:hypothetical protein